MEAESRVSLQQSMYTDYRSEKNVGNMSRCIDT